MPNIVESMLEETEALIKEMWAGHKSPKTLRESTTGILQKIREIRKMVEEEKLSINVVHNYWVFWNSGTMETVTGSSIEDAFGRAGYGGGAARAIDFYTEIPTGKKMVERVPSMPDHPTTRELVTRYYLDNIRTYFRDLKESIPEKDYVHALEDFDTDYAEGVIPFPELHLFKALHLDLVRTLNPVTRHGKMYYAKFDFSQDGSIKAGV